MSYRVLLTGKDNSTIDTFFLRLVDEYELLTTSTRLDDMLYHIERIPPHVFIICLTDETNEEIAIYTELKRRLGEKSFKTIIIADKEQGLKFQQLTLNYADYILAKPVTPVSIKKAITKVIEGEPETVSMPVSAAGGTGAVNEMLEAMKQEERERRKHILIVDDEPLMLKMIKEQLRDEYDVATAISGKLALNFLRNKPTDVILLDYEMPEENGVEVFKKLRSEPSTSEIPVIFLTGVSDKEKIHEVLAYQPQGYILKPVSKKKLLDTLDHVIEEKINKMFEG